MSLLYKHPNAVSGVAVDGDRIATSCFDGFVRLFDLDGKLLTAEWRASQLQCVALRDGVIASDFDTASGLKEGVAIAPDGTVIGQPHFSTLSRILAVSRSGQFGVAIDQKCYNRLADTSWVVVPESFGHDKWPMGVVESSDGEVFTVDQTGYIRGWRNGVESALIKIHSPGLAVDLSHDQALFVVSDENRGLSLYNRIGQLLKRVEELSLVKCCAFLPDRRIAYGTHDGRLCVWDGFSDLNAPQPPEPPSTVPGRKPGKGKGK